MIISSDNGIIEQLSRAENQWKYLETNSLIQMQDLSGKTWILRDKSLFKTEEETERITALHASVLARFQAFTGVYLPQTYLIKHNNEYKYLCEYIPGSNIRDLLLYLIDQRDTLSGKKKHKVKKQIKVLKKVIESLLCSLFEYYINSFKLNLPCLVDMKLDQFVISENHLLTLVDLDPDLRKFGQFINFFSYLKSIESILSNLVEEFLEIANIMNDPNWGEFFYIIIKSSGYSIDQLIIYPRLKDTLQMRLKKFNYANEVFINERGFTNWEI